MVLTFSLTISYIAAPSLAISNAHLKDTHNGLRSTSQMPVLQKIKYSILLLIKFRLQKNVHHLSNVLFISQQQQKQFIYKY